MAEGSALDRDKWYNVDPDEPQALAAAILARVTAIENWVMGARFQNQLYARLATGRDMPIAFGIQMQRRVGPMSAVFTKSQFELPVDNVVALGVETLYNRIGTSRPWVTVVPDGDFNARTQAKAQEAWFAKIFERKRVYPEIVQPGFLDAEIWGDGFALVDIPRSRRDVRYTRIFRDEVLVDEIEAARGSPGSIILSRIVNREELLEEWGDDKDAYEAIETAPGAIQGAVGGTSLGDVVQVFNCYKLPDDEGEHGRHTLMVNARSGYVLKDEKWTRPRFPLARLKGIPQPMGYWNMGIPEAGWDYQLEINRCMAVIHEGQKHGAIGTILARNDAHISTKQLASSLQQRIVRYDGIPPEFIAPPAVSQEIYAYRNQLKADFLMRIGISPNQAGGTKEEGLTSGRALITMEQIHDGRNVNWGKNLEDFVTDLADLTYEAAAEVKLSVDTPEGHIDWSDVEMAPGGARRRAFPISALPSEPAGRQQRIATWYANGFISRAEAFRLEDVPDTERFVSLASAVQDELEWTLDKIVTEGRYYPPEVYDLDGTVDAVKMANARYHYEKRRGAPQNVLRQLRKFMAALGDLAADPALLPQAQPAPAVAPSPVQASPDMPAPAAPAPGGGAPAPMAA